MRRSDRLSTVHDVAEEVERQAATTLAQAEARVAEAESKLAELERYERDYRDLLQNRTTSGIGAAQLRGFHGFIGRLGEAIAQQRGVVARAHEERAVLRERWLETNRRARSLGKAVERAGAEERRVEDRREQQASDERAQRAFTTAALAAREEPPRTPEHEEFPS